MFSEVTSGAIHGIDSHLVSVEVDVAQGLPGFDIVGFVSSEVKEAKERVRVALKNAEISLPAKRITVNLSPANIRKEGSAYDLPIAVGIALSLEQIPKGCTQGTLVIGELGLDGAMKAVRGILPIVAKAKQSGYRRCIVPADNAREGAVIQDIEIIGVSTLRQTLTYLAMPKKQQSQYSLTEITQENQPNNQSRNQPKDRQELSDISGQETAKRALEIAAAGFHNLLLIGPPGSGKTMLAKRIPSLLPTLTPEESLEVTTIYSVAGKLPASASLITERPFLNPHHTISEKALAGGGLIPKPGIMSLAHRGVLFLDELPEFKRTALEWMRQPLEDKEIYLARSYGNYTYPADFMLVAAMNPCPCGYYPNRNRCSCTPFEIHRYLSRISGPILDRIDISTETTPVELKDFLKEAGSKAGQQSDAARKERLQDARARQIRRLAEAGLSCNAQMGVREIKRFCSLREKERALSERIFDTMQLSMRAYHRMLKVARTIADLDGADNIGEAHLAEAAYYRVASNKYWREEKE